jgi:MFS family permease
MSTSSPGASMLSDRVGRRGAIVVGWLINAGFAAGVALGAGAVLAAAATVLLWALLGRSGRSS